MPETRASKSTSSDQDVGGPGDNVPTMKLTGPPVSDFLVVPSSNLGLFCGTGEVGDETVLVPYIQMRLLKLLDEDEPGDELSVTEAFQGTLAFENAAFLIMDLARDFRAASKRLSSFSTGEMKPEPTRLAYGARCLRSARSAIDEAIGHLEALDTSAEPETPKPTNKTRKPVIRKRKAG